ncbi:serine/threonine-protein kinase ppk35-like [Cornus florida]|uniref:serine/threonine-protein kinase ppk35-like n=1 Tax=Cornus florida TaxID=4283 RepID=UPI00289751C1|nr:serine/threonine-protein kinase ppk35-like [Cornus florida]
MDTKFAQNVDTKKGVRARCCNSGILPEDSAPPPEIGVNSASFESDSAAKLKSFIGMEDYVAPKIILGKVHNFAVDCWCLGVILNKMLYGTTQFRGLNRKETFHRILKKLPVTYVYICQLIQNEKGYRIRSDNGGEFEPKDFIEYYDKFGIKHEFSTPKTTQQNGVVERVVVDHLKQAWNQNGDFGEVQVPKLEYKFHSSSTKSTEARKATKAKRLKQRLKTWSRSQKAQAETKKLVQKSQGSSTQAR